jgi:hypothetical protein
MGNIMQLIQLKENFEFIAAGTFLGRNVNGDYFVLRDDVPLHESAIDMNGGIVVSGHFLLDSPHLYQVIDGVTDLVDAHQKIRTFFTANPHLKNDISARTDQGLITQALMTTINPASLSVAR